MKVIAPGDVEIVLGVTETTPTIGITDYSRRVTDDFGITTVVPRAFSRRMSVRFALPSDQVDAVQADLADLRATEAQWIADEDFAWLNFAGFYKDFSIDLAVGAISYCTLTVEGLAETETLPDAGEDPAPSGASTFTLIQPVQITGAALVASNVAETDYAEWSANTIYALGAHVIKAATHRIYESATANNIGNDPTGLSGVWIDIGPTNRWAMFDEALGTLTTRGGGITLTLAPGAVDALALLDVTGATVRVQTTGYDVTKAVVGGAVTFLDLPGIAANIIVTVAGAGTVSVGTLLVGALVTLGVTEENPSAGITDYSRKEVDDFGAPTIVERAWAKRFSGNSLIRTDAVDIVANRIAAVRARPALWIADDGTDALTVYGFFKDFSIEVGEAVSKVALSIEGLSKAAPLMPPAEPAQPPTNIAPTPPLDLPEGTLWIAPDGHPYRFGRRPWTSNGATWISNGEGWLGGGYSDAQDQLGILAKQVADAVTAQVARIASDNWLTAGEKAGLVLSHKALIENYIALNAKAIAIGVAGAERTAATAAVNALNAYLVGLVPAWDDTTQDTPADGPTVTALWGTAATTVAALQAAIQGLAGPAGMPGVNGEDGNGIEFVWKRAAAAPAAPVGNGIPAGWSDDPPAGTDPLWVSKAKQKLDGTLLPGESWSVPVRQNGEDGAPGDPGSDGLSIAATRPILTIALTAGGSPKAGELPKSTQMIVYDGLANVTATVAYTVAVSGCTVSNDGGGAFTLTAVSSEAAYFDVTATAPDGRAITMRIPTTQPKDGSAASRASANVASMNATSTYAAIATADIVAAAGATISGSGNATYLAASFAGAGTRSVRQQARVTIENLTDAGSPNAGTAQVGSAATYIGGDGPSDVGSVSAGHSVTNSTGAPKTFRVKFEIRYYDGATTAQTAGGTYTGKIEVQVA